MRNRAPDTEELSREAPPGCLACPCPSPGRPTGRQERISNGEVIEKLQRLGGDWFAPSPVLQVSDSVGRGNAHRPVVAPFILPKSQSTRKPRDAGVESLNCSLISAVPKLHGPMFGGEGGCL